MVDRFRCDVCGYVHEGATPPSSCPICGVGRDQFSPMEVAPAPTIAISSGSWKCSVCGYVHTGDAPPDVCPVCSVDATLFDAMPGAAQGEVTDATGPLVILGAGVAGVTAAEAARRIAPNRPITLVSGEPHLPYYRLNLTRYLAEEVGEAELAMTSAERLREQGIDWVVADAMRVHRQHRRVDLTGGRSLDYDALVVAMGSHPFVPPVPGFDKRGVCVLRWIDDAREILRRSRTARHCVCIGGGLLGLEAAGALAGRNLDVTVLEGHGWLLPRQLAEPAGKLLQQQLEQLGVQVRNHARAVELTGTEDVSGVRLKDGAVLDADLVVVATGVRPSSWLARQCGLEVERGILVDDRMATSDPAIFAAGDVAEHRGTLYSIWPTAFAQGEVAGINAAGGRAEYRGMPPSNRLKIVGTDVYSVGQFTAPDGSYEVIEEEGDGTYLRLVVRDGRLLGANLIGRTHLVDVVRDAVEEGKPLFDVPSLSRYA
jgi:nitrite reductase (NADH) large subunit